MVWNDKRILDWAQAGGVTPFDATCVNPASLDLRLGDLIREPHPVWLDMTREEMRESIELSEIDDFPKWGEAKRFDKFWLFPGEFVLCHSLELVRIPDNCMSLLFSKSSTGRTGLEHLHAGLGDSSFNGQWVFELHNVAPWPIKLEAGKRYMQMTILQMADAPLLGYDKTGRYNGQSGPTPVRPERES